MRREFVFNNHRGAIRRSLDLSGIRIAEIAHSGGPADRHSHADPSFWLMVRGTYQVDTETQRQVVGPTSLVYTASDEPHFDHIREIGSFGMTVSLSRDYVAEQLGPVSLPARSTILTDPRLLAIAQRVRAELHAPDDFSQLVISGLIIQLLGEVCRASLDQGDPLWSKRALDAISAQYHLPDLSVASLAREVGAHPVHLARVFRKSVGCPPSEYIRLYRCKRAAELLARSEVSLSDIAHDCGFSDQSSFTHAFRRSYGTTPGAYRRVLS